MKEQHFNSSGKLRLWPLSIAAIAASALLLAFCLGPGHKNQLNGGGLNEAARAEQTRAERRANRQDNLARAQTRVPSRTSSTGAPLNDLEVRALSRTTGAPIENFTIEEAGGGAVLHSRLGAVNIPAEMLDNRAKTLNAISDGFYTAQILLRPGRQASYVTYLEPLRKKIQFRDSSSGLPVPVEKVYVATSTGPPAQEAGSWGLHRPQPQARSCRWPADFRELPAVNRSPRDASIWEVPGKAQAWAALELEGLADGLILARLTGSTCLVDARANGSISISGEGSNVLISPSGEAETPCPPLIDSAALSDWRLPGGEYVITIADPRYVFRGTGQSDARLRLGRATKTSLSLSRKSVIECHVTSRGKNVAGAAYMVGRLWPYKAGQWMIPDVRRGITSAEGGFAIARDFIFPHSGGGILGQGSPNESATVAFQLEGLGIQYTNLANSGDAAASEVLVEVTPCDYPAGIVDVHAGDDTQYFGWLEFRQYYLGRYLRHYREVVPGTGLSIDCELSDCTEVMVPGGSDVDSFNPSAVVRAGRLRLSARLGSLTVISDRGPDYFTAISPSGPLLNPSYIGGGVEFDGIVPCQASVIPQRMQNSLAAAEDLGLVASVPITAGENSVLNLNMLRWGDTRRISRPASGPAGTQFAFRAWAGGANVAFGSSNSIPLETDPDSGDILIPVQLPFPSTIIARARDAGSWLDVGSFSESAVPPLELEAISLPKTRGFGAQDRYRISPDSRADVVLYQEPRQRASGWSVLVLKGYFPSAK